MVLRKLRHKNVINVIDVAVGDNLETVFMVMPYCEQGSQDVKSAFDIRWNIENWSVDLMGAAASPGLLDMQMGTANLVTMGLNVVLNYSRLWAFQIISPLDPDNDTVNCHAMVSSTGDPFWVTNIHKISRPVVGWVHFCRVSHIATAASGGIRDAADLLDNRKAGHNTLSQAIPGATGQTIALLNALLAYDPRMRISARKALKHPYFKEMPAAQHPAMLPTFPEIRNIPGAASSTNEKRL
ncbi:hypothetical protein H4219_001536 [Mycoemilia scoparia]|uniref:Protein kinase domain-containing protein n=1 Tax=Mycoemilia scoparia TaxID=417184 RepID=A0A9W8DW00_9FUNG|nr:hypothetical protein H4219_001536 [Mycoemilia scoparia]